MTEPFAKTKHSKGVGPGYENMQTVLVMVGDRPCGQYPCFNDEKAANLSHELAETLTLHLNTAARKYAADKIRNAADALLDDGYVAVSVALRYHADAVERGEA